MYQSRLSNGLCFLCCLFFKDRSNVLVSTLIGTHITPLLVFINLCIHCTFMCLTDLFSLCVSERVC